MRRKKRPNKNLQPGEVPQRLRWRPRFRIIGFLSGLIGGLGAVVLVAQYGVAPLSRALSVQGLLGALFSGLILPSAVFAIVVALHNRRLDRALASTRNGLRGPSAKAVILLLMASAFAAPFVDTRTAFAEVSGPCGGEINGIDLADVNANAQDAFEILEGDTVRGSLFIDGRVTGGRAGLSMFGFEIAGDLESESEAVGRETFEFDYEDISWLGSGLIELWVDAELSGGASCEIRFMINIDGNPLDTVVGQAAAGAVGVGAAGMTLSGAGALLEGGRTMGDLRKALVQIGTAEHPGLDLDLGGSTGAAADAVTVAPGDNLWSLSEAELENRLGRPPTDAETTEFWKQVIEANADTLQSGDPDVIMPGETITFPGGGGPTEVSTGAGSAGNAAPLGETVSFDETTSVGDPSSTADGSASFPSAADVVETDVNGAVESSGDTSWWNTDAGESRTTVLDGAAGVSEFAADGAPMSASVVAGLGGMAALAMLVPARFLLLAKLQGGQEPGVIDPRLTAEVARQIEDLPVDEDSKHAMKAAGLDAAAEEQYDQLAQLLSIDFSPPSSVPEVTSWPPRVGAAIAWMVVADRPPMDQADLRDVARRSTYIDNLLRGVGRNIALIEEKAEWPWNSN